MVQTNIVVTTLGEMSQCQFLSTFIVGEFSCHSWDLSHSCKKNYFMGNILKILKIFRYRFIQSVIITHNNLIIVSAFLLS